MSQRDVFVDIALAQAGVLEYGFEGRCEWDQGETDCTGLLSGAARRSGCVFSGCPNSSAIARMAHDAPRPDWMNRLYGPDPYSGSTTKGTGITRAQALATRGGLGIRGDDEGRDGDGPKGHGKISLGDGRSIEAISHALDVRIWHFDDPRLSYFCLWPGMTGFENDPGQNPDPASAWEAATMGMIPIAVPGAHVQRRGKHKGSMPIVAALSSDGISWSIIGYNGAQLPAGTQVGDLSVLVLGKLNKPIENVGVVFIDDPDDHTHKPPHVIPSRQVLFVASDGGTFGPYRPTVHYA